MGEHVRDLGFREIYLRWSSGPYHIGVEGAFLVHILSYPKSLNPEFYHDPSLYDWSHEGA